MQNSFIAASNSKKVLVWPCTYVHKAKIYQTTSIHLLSVVISALNRTAKLNAGLA